MKNTIEFEGKTFDLLNPADAAELHARLVPATWPASPDECVKVFAAVRDITSFQLQKLLAQHWKNICKVAADERESGGSAEVPIGISFVIDQTAPATAAVSKFKIRFGLRFSGTARPQTHDVNQGDLNFEAAEAEAADKPEIEPAPEEPTTAEPVAGKRRHRKSALDAEGKKGKKGRRGKV